MKMSKKILLLLMGLLFISCGNSSPKVDYGLYIGMQKALFKDKLIQDVELISEKKFTNKLKILTLKADLIISVKALKDTEIKTASGKLKSKLEKGESGKINVLVMSFKNDKGMWNPSITIVEPDFD